MRIVIYLLVFLLGVLTAINCALTVHAAREGSYEPIPVYLIIAGLSAISWVSLVKEGVLRRKKTRFHRPKRRVERFSSRVGSGTGGHVWALFLECGHLVFATNRALAPPPTIVRCQHCYKKE